MRKIRTTIIIVIGIFVVLSLGTTGLITLTTATTAIENETAHRLESIAQQKSAELETKLLIIESHVQSLNITAQSSFNALETTNESGAELLNNYIDTMQIFVLETIKSLPSSYSTYIVLDPSAVGQLADVVYIRTGEENFKWQKDLLTPEDLEVQTEDLDWWRLPILKKQGRWTDPYYDYFLEKKIITYSEPIIVNGKIIGVVGTDILFEDFENFIYKITVFETGYAFLMNSNHDILVHPILGDNINMRTMEDGLYVPISNRINLYKHGTLKYNFFGSDKIMGFSHLYNGWVIGIAPPLDEVNTILEDTRRSFIYTLLGGIGIFIILGSIIGKYISRPIEYLTQIVTSIGEGNLESPVDDHLIAQKSEIGILATTIDQMREQQKAVIEELRHHNDSLEDNILERTSELLTTNQKLENTITSLTSAQETIVEMREAEVLSDLIQHLTQKLSTPITTSMTAADFLLKKSEPSLVDIEQSALLISDNQLLLKNILDSLRQLTTDYTKESLRFIPLKAHIHHTIKNVLSEHLNTTLDITIDGDDQLLAYLPMDVATQLFSNLIHHSLRASKEFKSKEILIQLFEDDDGMHIKYNDIIPWQPNIEERIFNPYYEADFIKDSSGLELYLIRHIIAKGLQGSITPFESANHHLGFHIIVPNNKQ